jgi:hypothetical protein
MTIYFVITDSITVMMRRQMSISPVRCDQPAGVDLVDGDSKSTKPASVRPKIKRRPYATKSKRVQRACDEATSDVQPEYSFESNSFCVFNFIILVPGLAGHFRSAICIPRSCTWAIPWKTSRAQQPQLGVTGV